MFGFRLHKEEKKSSDIVFIVLIVFLLYQLITRYLLCPFLVNSESMMPEFVSGSRILSTPIYSVSSLKRGSLVLISKQEEKYNFFQKFINSVVGFFTLQIYIPFNKQNKDSTKYLLRRIVGMPGDTIYMKDFILYVKKQGEQHFLTEFEVAECDYNINTEELFEGWKGELPFSGTMVTTTLKEGEYFLLSDNRLMSFDSTVIGKIDAQKDVKQKVLFRYWPLNNIKIF